MSKNHVAKSETVGAPTQDSVAAKAAEEAEFAKMEADEAAKNAKSEEATVSEERPKAPSVLSRAKIVTPVAEEPVAPPQATVDVLPLRTELTVRVGPETYHFIKGKPTAVPREIVPHLERCGIVAPSIH